MKRRASRSKRRPIASAANPQTLERRRAVAVTLDVKRCAFHRSKWMSCSACDEWYHPSCMGLLDYDHERIEVWVCPNCEQAGM